MILIFRYTLILILSSYSLSQENLKIKTIVILGDSISEGYGVEKEKSYPILLEKKLNTDAKHKVKVISSSINGSTTASGPSRITWIMKNKPDIVIVALGGNDGLRGLKVSESQKNLEKTIELLQNKKVKVVVAGMKMPPNYGESYTKEFYKMYNDLKFKYKLPLIPFLLDKVGGNKSLNQEDGIHPNEEGHKIIADTVYQVIKGLL